GSHLNYVWQKGTTPVSGGTNATLTFASLKASDNGDYRVIVSNSAGSVTSAVATVTAITPVPGSYEELIVNAGPLACWRFNETNATPGFDYYGGHAATYSGTGTNGVEAPRAPQFPGFEAGNLALQLDGSGYVGGPTGLMNNLNAFTMAGW